MDLHKIGVAMSPPNPIPTVLIFCCFWTPNCVLIPGKIIKLRLDKNINMSIVYIIIISSF